MSLTAQQPYNNVVRTALQALAAVLGGTNSLHTNSLDEALALPTEEAATLALRTQQIIAYESGVTDVVDPLGGSYFVETLTSDIEEGALRYFDHIDRMGGMVAAIERASRSGRSPRAPTGSSRPSSGGEGDRRRERLRPGGRAADRDALHRRSGRRAAAGSGSTALRRGATAGRVHAALDALRKAAAGTTDNLMPPILDAVRAYATVGEMCDALRDVWGEYEEVPII